MRDERGPWYLLTGLALGLAIGLSYAWVIAPREVVVTSPASMRSDFKDQYRALIAAAFVANSNLPRAQARLNLLGDPDVARALAEQAQRSLAAGNAPEEARALGLLSVALGQEPAPVDLTPAGAETGGTAPASPTGAPQAAPATSLPPTTQPAGEMEAAATAAGEATPLPSRTPTAIPEGLYVLEDRTFICDQDLGEPLIQVQVKDARGNPVPGVEIVVNWEGGEEHFFTGLKPELGLGYADFTMTPDQTYTVRPVDGLEPVSGLAAAECETSAGSRYWGSWLLVFEKP